MKKITIPYWIFTILFVGMMLFDAWLDITHNQQAIDSFNMMKMPLYLLPFYGVVKIAGSIGILTGSTRIKEWSYAILLFGVIEAGFAMILSGQPAAVYAFMAIPLILGVVSYILYRKRLRAG